MELPDKRVKLSRSKTSCLKCRSRKAKCGALPPATCPYCARHGLKCIWPAEDRRRARSSSHGHVDVAEQTMETSELVEAESGGTVPSGQQENTSDTTASQQQLWDSMVDSSGSDPFDGDQGALQASGSDQVWPWTFSPSVQPTLPTEPISFDLGSTMRDLFGIDQDTSNMQIQFMLDQLNPGDWSSGTRAGPVSDASGMMQIRYMRTHGRTAYVPGTLSIPIKIQLQRSPQRLDLPIEAHSPESPNPRTPPDVFKHLLSVFRTYLGPHYPCVDVDELERSIDQEWSPGFLLNCVAASAARFSHDPRVALRHLKPEAYGDVFYERANAMLGSVLRLPLVETVIGCMLLACCADSVTGQWMMIGVACRMAVDLGLHRRDTDNSDPETSRQKRLTFWCVLITDYMITLGVGRTTSLRPESITQDLPSQEDMRSSTRSPFPHAVEMMQAYGRLINLLNAEDSSAGSALDEVIRAERVHIMGLYRKLPPDMQWSPENLRMHNASGQASMLLHIHLWVHMILSNSILPSPDAVSVVDVPNLGITGVVTPIAQLDRSGAKLTCDFLSLCTLIDPAIYYTQAFLGQPLFTAAQVIIKELQRHNLRQAQVADSDSELDMTSSLLTTMAQTQLELIKRALTETGGYWRGVILVQHALDQIVAGPARRDDIWQENHSYAVEVYGWSLPSRYRTDGSRLN